MTNPNNVTVGINNVYELLLTWKRCTVRDKYLKQVARYIVAHPRKRLVEVVRSAIRTPDCEGLYISEDLLCIEYFNGTTGDLTTYEYNSNGILVHESGDCGECGDGYEVSYDPVTGELTSEESWGWY